MIEEDIKTLQNTLLNKSWRLNNLYYIRDKVGNLILLKLNYAQKLVADIDHPRIIIVKSRQQGISTLYLADNLDSCLFIEGYQAGIQSYGNEESKKLQKRALLMWNELDPLVKESLGISLTASNSTGLEFSNGSILKIGNFRGDTLQSLHVSELAKISKKYPEKARELKTGAFQAVSTNSKITIESTAEGNTGLFPSIWFDAVAMKNSPVELTPLDFYPIFIGWQHDLDCQMDNYTPPTKALEEYLILLKKELPDLTLTQPQINWLTTKLRALGDDFNSEYPATPAMAFANSIEGTYFAKQYEVILEENRIQDITYNPNYLVYTSWDIGVNDEMVILFWQILEGSIVLIDEYHNTGEWLEYYVNILNAKPYQYAEHILPHDINVNDVSSSDRTRLHTLSRLGLINIRVLDSKLRFAESIAVARSLLVGNLLISSKCKGTISAIQNYRKKKDIKLDVYMDIDVHDIHSNYMASFRYAGQGLSQHLVTSHSTNYDIGYSYSSHSSKNDIAL